MWGRGAALTINTTPAWRGVNTVIMRGSSRDGNQQQTRRHSRSKSLDSLADLVAPLSPAELIDKVASQVWLYAGLAFKLYSYLGLGKGRVLVIAVSLQLSYASAAGFL